MITSVAISVLAVQAVMLVYGAWSIGIGFDEWYHIRLDWVQQYYASRNPVAFGTYGYSTQYIGHIANILVGNEKWLEVYNLDSSGYAVRHLSFAFLGICGVATASYMAWVLVREVWVAILAAAILTALPVWTGHAMMNPKDIPVAVGYTMVTAGLVGLTTYRRTGLGQWRVMAPWLLLALGVFVAAGFRLGMGTPFLITLMLFISSQFAVRSLRRAITISAIATSAYAFGVLLIVIANPYLVDAFSTELIRQIFFGSRAYPWQGVVLFDGSTYPGTGLPRTYWLFSIALALPLLILLGFLLGVVYSVREWLRSVRRRSHRLSPLGAALGLVLAQVVMLPTAATILRVVDYDSQRHHLYVYPAIATLTSLGFCSLIKSSASSVSVAVTYGRRRLTVGLSVLGILLALVIPTIEGGLLFPYNYVYMNALASIGGVNGRWETDYWGLGMRETQNKIPKGILFSVYGASGNTFSVYESEQGSNSEIVRLRRGYRLLLSVPRGSWKLTPGCTKVGGVTRWLRGETIDVSVIEECPTDSIARK